MPSDNKISVTLSNEDKAAVIAAFDTILGLLPFLQNLSPVERQRMPTLGTERTAMDQTFAAEMVAHPELVPGYVDMAELAKDRALWAQLAEIASKAREVCEGIEDTAQIAGSDIYMAYLSFYQAARQAARRNVVGADALYANLRQYFPRGGGGGGSGGSTPQGNG